MVFFGAIASLDFVWNMADLFMAFMTIINLIAILLLGRWALKALHHYQEQKRQGIKEPTFKSSDLPEIQEQLSAWD